MSALGRLRTLEVLRRALELTMTPKKMPKIVSFAEPVEAEHSAPDPAKLLAGRPVHTTRNHYADGAQQFFSGIWSSTEGKWRVQYGEHEFCSLLEGHVRLQSDDGSVVEFHAGDSFVIPAGFTGTWETVQAVRKLYVIYVPAAAKLKAKPRRKAAVRAPKKKIARRRRK